jgi:hypothetical protein
MNKVPVPALIVFMIVIGFFMQGVSAVAPEGAPPLVIPPRSTDDAPSVSESLSQSPSGSPAPVPFSVWTLIGIVLVIVGVSGCLLLRRKAEYMPKSKRLQK